LSKRHNSRFGARAGAPAPLFAALGDSTRLRIVAHLCDGGPMSITRLSTGFRVTRQAISKHLRVLEGAGLVRSKRRGRESIWQLEHRRLREARRYLELISLQWDDALGQLRTFVGEQTKTRASRAEHFV
jgi:DNA-binding transcriptional ArsR family regulator